jgi:hypothetical protein
MELSDRPVHAPGVVSSTVEGEEVVVHPQQGMVRVLNAVGARLWTLADGRHSVAEAAQVIECDYEVRGARAATDALAFYRDLLARGLIRIQR